MSQPNSHKKRKQTQSNRQPPCLCRRSSWGWSITTVCCRMPRWQPWTNSTQRCVRRALPGTMSVWFAGAVCVCAKKAKRVRKAQSMSAGAYIPCTANADGRTRLLWRLMLRSAGCRRAHYAAAGQAGELHIQCHSPHTQSRGAVKGNLLLEPMPGNPGGHAAACARHVNKCIWGVLGNGQRQKLRV